MAYITHTQAIPVNHSPVEAPEWFLRKAKFAKRFFLNLAPIRYAMIAEEGGPVESVEYACAEYLGRTWQLSRANLQDAFRCAVASKIQLFSNADGSGIGTTRLEARAKAISEALERWAFMETSAGTDAVLYGYNHSMSSKGMAAFPSLFASTARSLAVAEAHEYFSIDAWWAGCLQHWSRKVDGGLTVFIDSVGFSGYIALAIRDTNASEYRAAYGIGSGRTPDEAEFKAHLEACRCSTVLQARASMPKEQRQQPVLKSEARLLHFAGKAGHQSILDRIEQPAWLSPITPRVIFDGPLEGPWSRYAHVWRHALEPCPVSPTGGHFLFN